jgi:cyclopropane fatty-acyl-phospholipid synthase-like methyltransferase
VYHSFEETLETGQKNKMDRVCKKLQLKPGQRFLDIGCGWGTLTRHAAKYFGAQSTGVTLSKEGKAWCDGKNEEEKLTNQVDILCCHYREIPQGQKFNKVSSIEMAEHVGITHFQEYLHSVIDHLDDQGMFLMQVSGLRKGSDWHDVQWGLFMSKYIFPGADASTPLAWYVRQLEQAGFEINSVETIGKHYSYTLLAWYNNWLKNKDEIGAKYGAFVTRLWVFFLAWSVIAAGTGSATCYQILCHKNTNVFDRNVFIGKALPMP